MKRTGRSGFANVIACVALFVALGGTAIAAVTLPRDSVGAPQIRNQSIGPAEISNRAAAALRGDLGVVQGDLETVTRCTGLNISVCPDLYVLPLASGGARNWLIQARLNLFVQLAPESGGTENRCGLVDTGAAGRAGILDELRIQQLRIAEEDAGMHTVVLNAVVRKRANNPTIAVRCTEQADEQNVADLAKITALEVGKVIGP